MERRLDLELQNESMDRLVLSQSPRMNSGLERTSNSYVSILMHKLVCFTMGVYLSIYSLGQRGIQS